MRILELEISNIRGIHNQKLVPNGKNFLIWGPNGSGKSAVIDAVDFLLTGKISRLTGRGTKDITLKKHGPHIDRKPKEAEIRAIIQLPNSTAPIEIKRSIGQPNILNYNKKYKRNLLPIFNIAGQGQFVLTRRDILRYITSDPSTRADRIQQLLNITDIENIRKSLVNVQSDLKEDFQVMQNIVDKTKGSIIAIIQTRSFNEGEILQVINKYRSLLGGTLISVLNSKVIKKQLKPPTGRARYYDPENISFLLKNIKNLYEILQERNQNLILQKDKEIRSLLDTIRSKPESLKTFSRLKLIELGIKLIDQEENCPLCDKTWAPGELQAHLREKISKAELVKQHGDRIKNLATQIAESVNKTVVSIQYILKAKSNLEKEVTSKLKSWLDNLNELSIILSAADEKYPDSRFEVDQIKRLLAPKDIIEILDKIPVKTKKQIPEFDPEFDKKRNAWDTLVRLEENLKSLEKNRVELSIAKNNYLKAEKLLQNFIKARDTVLDDLYDTVSDRFAEIYRELHGEDEEDFTASFKPHGAGLNMNVGFYGRDQFPPNALHSEGHQDSMGICLYLVLSERLNQNLIDLTILDDVMMSIDSTHRREMCRLLKTKFPNRQFIITTHDRDWAHHLKTEGVVKPQDSVEFYNWHIDTGPQVNFSVELWKKIDDDLLKNDVASAAAKLRRGSEEFFSEVCESLCVKTAHKLNARWDLGELLPSAMHQYKELLKKAIVAAKSGNNQNDYKMLKDLECTMKSVFNRFYAEQWAINANVHYNTWTNSIKEDFEPVVKAFHDLFDVFGCNKCGGLLHVSVHKMQTEAVRCDCDAVNWNLVKAQITHEQM